MQIDLQKEKLFLQATHCFFYTTVDTVGICSTGKAAESWTWQLTQTEKKKL